jgi:putative Holliday junction resolvase
MIFNNKDDFLAFCPQGKLMGIDVGSKRIGLSICDDTRKICLPSDTFIRQGNKKDFPALKEIVEKKKVKGVVIGLPLSFDDSENSATKFVRKFTENFSKITDIPFVYQDERLSSFEAENLISGKGDVKKVVDKVASSYILEDFLN